MAIAKLFVDIGANIGGFKRGMRDVDTSINKTAKSAGILSNALGTGLGIVAAQGAMKLASLGKSIIATGTDFNKLEENSTIAFDTMLGGIDKAKKFMDELKVYAERTPFELPGLIEMTQKLKAFGFETEKILPMLTDIGDAVSGLGGSPALLNRITIALGQIRAKGRVQAQEMLQLTEAGIPAWELLANEMGVTIPEAMKLSEKGALEANKAIDDLLTGMRGRFGGLMEKQSKTYLGLSSTLNDVLRNLSSRLTKPWFAEMKEVLEDTLGILQSGAFQNFFDGVIEGSEKAASIVFGFTRKLIDFAKSGFDIFGSLFGGKQETERKKAILETTNILELLDKMPQKMQLRRFKFLDDFTIKETVLSITGFIDSLREVGPETEYWLGRMPRIIQPVAKAFETMYEYVAGGGVQKTLKQLAAIFNNVLDAARKLIRPFKEAFGALFDQLRATENIGFGDVISGLINALGEGLLGMLDVIKEEFWPTIKKGFVWLWNTIKDFFLDLDWSGLWDSFVTGVSNIATFISGIDWQNVFSSLTSGLSAIGDWLTENILPHLENFWNWLTSWFTDPEKSNMLTTALVSTWNFLSEWASKISGFIAPYLTSFWQWFISWFTDAEKNNQLLSALYTGWTFLTDWASKLWEFVSPVLSSVFGYILSWVTDSEKRGKLWEAIKKSWTFLTDWGKKLWDWLEPELEKTFDNIVAWVEGDETNPSLWERIKEKWTVFTDWAAALWGWMKPKLVEALFKLRAWIDENYPTFGTWLDKVKEFTRDTKKEFDENFPSVRDSFINLASTIKTETPLILGALDDLMEKFFGPGSWVDSMSWFFNKTNNALSETITQFRLMLEILGLMVETTKNVFSGGYSQEWSDNMSTLWAKWNELWSVTQNSNPFDFSNPPQPNNQNTVNGSSVVGASSAASSTARSGTNNINVTINGNVSNRELVDYMIREMQKKLNMQGNRVAFTN